MPVAINEVGGQQLVNSCYTGTTGTLQVHSIPFPQGQKYLEVHGNLHHL